MKSKIYLFGLVFALLFSLSACKTKQSAYQAAYEAAKARELQETNNQTTIEEVTPVTKPKPSSSSSEKFQVEKLTSVDGSGIQRYSVVIGSFVNKTNAESLRDRMKREGYSPVLAQNEKGMYRVIVASYNERLSAVQAREDVKDNFAPEFSDAWLLEQGN